MSRLSFWCPHSNTVVRVKDNGTIIETPANYVTKHCVFALPEPLFPCSIVQSLFIHSQLTYWVDSVSHLSLVGPPAGQEGDSCIVWQVPTGTNVICTSFHDCSFPIEGSPMNWFGLQLPCLSAVLASGILVICYEMIPTHVLSQSQFTHMATPLPVPDSINVAACRVIRSPQPHVRCAVSTYAQHGTVLCMGVFIDTQPSLFAGKFQTQFHTVPMGSIISFGLCEQGEYIVSSIALADNGDVYVLWQDEKWILARYTNVSGQWQCKASVLLSSQDSTTTIQLVNGDRCISTISEKNTTIYDAMELTHLASVNGTSILSPSGHLVAQDKGNGKIVIKATNIDSHDLAALLREADQKGYTTWDLIHFIHLRKLSLSPLLENLHDSPRLCLALTRDLNNIESVNAQSHLLLLRLCYITQLPTLMLRNKDDLQAFSRATVLSISFATFALRNYFHAYTQLTSKSSIALVELESLGTSIPYLSWISHTNLLEKFEELLKQCISTISTFVESMPAYKPLLKVAKVAVSYFHTLRTSKSIDFHGMPSKLGVIGKQPMDLLFMELDLNPIITHSGKLDVIRFEKLIPAETEIIYEWNPFNYVSERSPIYQCTACYRKSVFHPLLKQKSESLGWWTKKWALGCPCGGKWECVLSHACICEK